MPESPLRPSRARSWRFWPVLGALALSLTACPAGLLDSIGKVVPGGGASPPAPVVSGPPGNVQIPVLPKRVIKLTPSQVSVAIGVRDMVWKLTTVAPYRISATASVKPALNPDDVDLDRIKSIVAYPTTGGPEFKAGQDYRLALEINKVYRIEVTFTSLDGEDRVLTTLYKAPLELRGKKGDVPVAVTPATTLATTAVLKARNDKVASLDLEVFATVVGKVDAIIESNRQSASFASALQYADLGAPEGLSEVLSEVTAPASPPASGSASPSPMVDLVADLRDVVEEAARQDDPSNSLEPVGKEVVIEVPDQGQSEDQAREEAEKQAGDLDQNRGGSVEDARDEDDVVEVPEAPTPRPSVPDLPELPIPTPVPTSSSGGSISNPGSPVVSTPEPPREGELGISLSGRDVLYVPKADGSSRAEFPSRAVIEVKRGDQLLSGGLDFLVRGPSPDYVQVVRGNQLVVLPGAQGGYYALYVFSRDSLGNFEKAYVPFVVRADWSGEVIIEDPTEPVDPPPFQGRDPWSGSVIIEDEPGVAR